MFQELIKEYLKKLPTNILTTAFLTTCIFTGFLMSNTITNLVSNVQETKNDVKTLLINQASQNQLMREHERRLNKMDDELNELRKTNQ